jgi:hypothetical protein
VKPEQQPCLDLQCSKVLPLRSVAAAFADAVQKQIEEETFAGILVLVAEFVAVAGVEIAVVVEAEAAAAVVVVGAAAAG